MRWCVHSLRLEELLLDESSLFLSCTAQLQSLSITFAPGSGLSSA